MSSAAAGGANKTTKTDNDADIDAAMLAGGSQGEFAATSAVSAEAQQGDGPAAASASGSGATGGEVETVAVAVSCGHEYAVAACPVAVVAVGVNAASAGSENGVAAVGPEGAAASSTGANCSETSMRASHQANGDGIGPGIGDDAAVVRLLGAIRGELTRLAADTEAIKAELGQGDPLDGAAPATRREAASGGRRARAKPANPKAKRQTKSGGAKA